MGHALPPIAQPARQKTSLRQLEKKSYPVKFHWQGLTVECVPFLIAKLLVTC